MDDVPITDPVMIEVPMPMMPWYPSDLLWSMNEGMLTLPREDAVRLTAWVHQIALWRTKDLPMWLQYYNITVDPAPDIDTWLALLQK